jgi:hypothetical protein
MTLAQQKLVVLVEPIESEDARWRRWKAKGRADEARFRQKLRTVLVDVVGIAALGGAMWLAYFAGA